MQKPDALVTTVLGQRGSGKTSWVKQELRKIPRFILWDTLGEYQGFDVFTDIESLFSYVYDHRTGVLQAVFNCLEENEAQAFDTVCHMAGAVENVVLVVEEVDAYATPSIIPFDLKRCLKTGRHRGVGLICVSRRPAEINRLITSQTQRFICFKMFEPNDVRYMGSIMGERSRELIDLPVLHYLDWQHGEISKGVVSFGQEKAVKESSTVVS